MTEPRTSISKLRRRILDGKGMALTPHKKKPVPVEDLPDEYPKTDKMKYFERKYRCKIERVITHGSLSDVAAFFHYEVDRSTISRWRKHIFKYLGIVEVK